MVEEKEADVTVENKEKELNELSAPCWSVISFETVAASSLTYDEASKLLRELDQQKISGLCIVTDKSAARMTR